MLKLKSLLRFSAVRQTCGWFIAMYRWAREGDAVWLTLLVLGVAWLYICFGWPSADDSLRLRSVGTALQLLGILTVFLGYEHTRKEFGHSRAFVAAWHWLKGIPWRGPRPINRSLNITAGTASMVAEGQAVGLHATGLPVEKRLEILEAAMEKVTLEVSGFRREFREERTRQAKALQELQQNLETRTQETSRLLEAIHTGGLSMSIAGLLWLAIGVILTSVPDMLAST